MLVTIKGTVTAEIEDLLVVEVNGFGYGLRLPDADRSRMKVGDTVSLYIYEHIREDTHDLYAFQQAEDQQLFRQLLSVSGVGPKLALTIMSGVGGKQLRSAIAGGNSEVLESVSGVGKRTAERLVVELRSRLGQTLEGAAVGDGGGNTVVAALRQLGYPAVEAQAAANRVPAEVSGDEERLKYALKELGR